MALDAARWMVWNAAWRMDQEMPVGKESAMAKFYASDTAMKVTSMALDILGGYGYMKDYPMEKIDERRQAAADLRRHE